MENERNHVLLFNYVRSEERTNQDHCGPRPETFSQYSRRSSAGIPLVSEDEEIYKKEESARKERRLRLFWDSFPVIMRSWEKILKYPAMSNIPMDSIGLVPCFSGITLGALVFAWRASCMRCPCPHCQGTAYFIPVPHPTLGDFTCWYGRSPNRETEFPDGCLVYCSSCEKESEIYEHEHNPESKCRLFYLLLESWKRCCHPTYSNMLYERALHLLRLSEAYGEDLEEFGKPDGSLKKYTRIYEELLL